MATHRVIVRDLKTGAVVVDEEADITGVEVDEQRTFELGMGTMSPERFDGKVAASVVGIEMCPFDCSICRGD